MKMNRGVKTLWLDALCSGEYKKGTTVLKKAGKYSCLGLLCELYRINMKHGEWTRAGFILNGRLKKHTLHKEVMEWAGFDDSYGTYANNSTILMDNDRGQSFGTIADTVQKYF